MNFFFYFNKDKMLSKVFKSISKMLSKEKINWNAILISKEAMNLLNKMNTKINWNAILISKEAMNLLNKMNTKINWNAIQISKEGIEYLNKKYGK